MSAIKSISFESMVPAASAAGTGPVRLGGKDFAAVLSDTSANDAREIKNDEVREAADQLVASAFILPMLEQARNDPFKSDMFHGGKGEEVFGQQLDVIFADNITKSANFGISDALVRRFQPASTSNESQVNLRG
ncbi:MAG: rod-binding protein [Planctomycetota bacterium]